MKENRFEETTILGSHDVPRMVGARRRGSTLPWSRQSVRVRVPRSVERQPMLVEVEVHVHAHPDHSLNRARLQVLVRLRLRVRLQV